MLARTFSELKAAAGPIAEHGEPNVLQDCQNLLLCQNTIMAIYNILQALIDPSTSDHSEVFTLFWRIYVTTAIVCDCFKEAILQVLVLMW